MNMTDLIGDQYSVMAYALSTASSSSQSEIDEINSEIDAIKGAMIEMTLRINDIVDAKAKAIKAGIERLEGYGIDGVTVDYWIVWGIYQYTIQNVQYVSPTSFSYTNITPTLNVGDIIYIDNEEIGYSRCNIISITEENSIYTVVIGAGNNPIYDNRAGKVSNNINLNSFLYETGPATISIGTELDKLIEDWDFGWHHIYDPIDPETSKFYGLEARIESMSMGTSAISEQQIFQNNAIATYKTYTDWTPIIEDQRYYYVDETSFKCQGNLTSFFPSGTKILVNCGVDGLRGSTILSSEYVMDWKNIYTEVILVSDIAPYEPSLEVSAMKITFDDYPFTVQISGGAILSGATWVDPVTFHAPLDLTILHETITGTPLTSADGGTPLICEFDDPDLIHPFPTRYFRVYSAVPLSDPNYGCTIVHLSEGLPITPNIEDVEIDSTS